MAFFSFPLNEVNRAFILVNLDLLRMLEMRHFKLSLFKKEQCRLRNFVLGYLVPVTLITYTCFKMDITDVGFDGLPVSSEVSFALVL